MTGDQGSPPLTLDTGGSGRQAAFLPAGPLQGEVRDGHACFWFPAPSGQAVSLVWPEGLVAKDDSLRVENIDGQVVAQVGDTVTDPVGGNISEGPGCGGGDRRWFLHAETFASSADFWHT